MLPLFITISSASADSIAMTSLANPANWIKPRRQYVYYLKEGSVDDREILGIKGSNLCEMFRLGLPVPPAFTLSAPLCVDYHKNKVSKKEWMDEVRIAVGKMESKTGNKFGGELGPARPLMFSVRSSMTKDMPEDMLRTILNLGINRTIVDALAQQTNSGRWALQTYIKFLKSFGTQVMGVDAVKFDKVLETIRARKNVPLDSLFTMEDLHEVVEKFRLLAIIPDDPFEQLEMAIEGMYKAWYSTKATQYRDIHNLKDHGVAVTVQCMVFGNTNVLSGTGVAVTRHPFTGKKEMFGYYMANAEQGDELLEAKRRSMSLEELHTEQPEVFDSLLRAVDNLETHYKDAQEIEFTVQDLHLFVLETKAAVRRPLASVKIAVDMEKEKFLTEREALLRLKPEQMEYFLHPVIDVDFVDSADAQSRLVGTGTRGTGGAVTGNLAFTLQQAKVLKGRDESCVLVLRESTLPGQEELLELVDGVIVLGNGSTSHTLVTMRTFGKPAITGFSTATLATDENSIIFDTPTGPQTVLSGEAVTIDGQNLRVYNGIAPITPDARNEDYFTVMTWAERHKRIDILATADTPRDIQLANVNGAEGIGLCRVEKFFLQDDCLELVRRFVLADSVTERSQFLVQLIPLHQKHFEEIFGLTGNCHMSVRLLDPSLHEFLPSPESPTYEEELQTLSKELHLPYDQCNNRILAIQEENPLVGFRGAKLGIVFPEITEMQVKAIIGAAVSLKRRNFVSLPQIILPNVSTQGEVERLTSIITTVSDNVCAKAWTDSSFNQQTIQSKISCMLQTPRACLQAGGFAKAPFICDVMFNTDVLTSMMFGMDRADSYSFMNTYLQHHIVAHDPFVSLDLGGVGTLMRATIHSIREKAGDKTVRIGVSGEHASDPHSVHFFERLGVDYVSCSPYRIPIAKVAAAQAHIQETMRLSDNKTALRMF